MSRHHDREPDWDRVGVRCRDRDSWTDIAYLIVGALALVLVARLWSRVIQPWAAGVLAQLTWWDRALWAGMLVLLVAVVRAWARHRRRRAARGLRVVLWRDHPGAPDPMSSEKSPAQGRVKGGRRPSRSDAKRP